MNILRITLSILVLLISIVWITGCGGNDEDSTYASSTPTPNSNYALTIHANELSKAITSNDFEKIVDLTYPKVVEMVGGRMEMITLLKEFIEEEGITFISVSIDDPEEIISIENRLFAILPTTIKIKVENGTLLGESFQIGISEDHGETWTFIDGSGVGSNRGMLKILFSSTLNELNLPDIELPTFYPDKDS